MDSPAERAGLYRGAAIVAVGGTVMKYAMHEEVVKRIKDCGGSLELKVQGKIQVLDLQENGGTIGGDTDGHIGAATAVSFPARGKQGAISLADEGIGDSASSTIGAFKNPLYHTTTLEEN